MDDRTEREIIARLDYVEKYRVNLGQVSGCRYAPLGSTPAPGQGASNCPLTDVRGG